MDRKQNRKAEIVHCRKAKTRKLRAGQLVLVPVDPSSDRCQWALVTERPYKPARRTSFTATQVSRVHTDHCTTPGEPDAGDPPVRFGGRGRPQGLSLPLTKRCGAERVSARLFAAVEGRSVPDT